jgi:hypothetical protein
MIVDSSVLPYHIASYYEIKIHLTIELAGIGPVKFLNVVFGSSICEGALAENLPWNKKQDALRAKLVCNLSRTD